MKYYLHDTSAFDDDKVTELFIYFGYEGVGLFYVILEKLAKQEKPVKTDVLKKQLRIGKKLEKCWKFMEEIGIISSNNGETFNKQLLNFSERYQIKKEKTRKKVSEWRDKQDNIDNVTCYNYDCNQPKVKESKVKESKVNNIELVFPSEQFSELWSRWIKYKKEEHKDSYKTTASEQVAINNLISISNSNEEIAAKIVEKSIANRYKGLFELKSSNGSTNGFQQPQKSKLESAIEIHSEVDRMLREQQRLNLEKNG